VVLGTLRALVVPLREHWGQVERFCQAGLEIFSREGGGALFDAKQSPAHLEQLYRQVVRARALHFRAVEHAAQLEQLFKGLELAANASPVQQSVLWLASRLQQQAIGILQNPRIKSGLRQILATLDERRGDLLRALGPLEKLGTERVEAALGALAQSVVGNLSTFEQSTIGGHLLEIVRKAARRPPRLGMTLEHLPQNDALTPLLAALLEPVRTAELNDAQARYARMGDAEKNRLFNDFRRGLVAVATEVAPYAPEGFRTFCQAVETRLFPYPQPLQFIRPYARPVWNTGAQSSLFAAAQTPQNVQHIYETLAKARQGNPAVLEIAYAFAMRNFREDGSAPRESTLHELDLKTEFNWPATLDALQRALEVNR
jgi:hypothetical protein